MEILVKMASLGDPEKMVLMDHLENLVNLVFQAIRVSMVQMELLENGVPLAKRANKEPADLKDHQVDLANLVFLVILEDLDFLVRMADLENLDFKDQKGIQVYRVCLDLDSLELLEKRATKVIVDFLVKMADLDVFYKKVHADLLVLKANRDCLDLLDPTDLVAKQ